METAQISPTILALILTSIGIAVTVVGTLGGFGYRTLNNRISEIKADAAKALEQAKIDIKESLSNEERRRTESGATMLQTMSQHYELLRNELHEIKTDIRDLRDDK